MKKIAISLFVFWALSCQPALAGSEPYRTIGGAEMSADEYATYVLHPNNRNDATANVILTMIDHKHFEPCQNKAVRANRDWLIEEMKAGLNDVTQYTAVAEHGQTLAPFHAALAQLYRCSNET